MAAKISESQGRRNRAQQARRPREPLPLSCMRTCDRQELRFCSAFGGRLWPVVVEKKFRSLASFWRNRPTPLGQLRAVRADRQSPDGFRPDLLRGRQARGGIGKLGKAGVFARRRPEGGARARINVLAQVKAALGDLDKGVRVVRLGGSWIPTPNFLEGPRKWWTSAPAT